MSKFSTVWANVQKENGLLRLLVLVLATLTLGMGVVAAKLSLKAPLIIDRACASRPIAGGDTARTEEEIEAFLREAVASRFNSDTQANVEFLSIVEIKAREAEQAELKRRELAQRVFVNSVKKFADLYQLDTDRLLSVGQVRSVFIFPLEVKVETTSRSALNPYGLVLTKILPVKTEVKK